MDRLILARHAESVFNVRGVLDGDPSIPGGLSDNGRAQALRLGERLAGEPIGLCVTTEFERTRETADIALAGRDVPRLVTAELNDPPNGELELRPYAELVRWRESSGPDVPIPGLDRTERDYFGSVARGFRRLAERPEPIVLAILHGYVVAWITGSAGAPASAGHAAESVLSAPELSAALAAVGDDVFRLWSWETSGRPLLRGPLSTSPEALRRTSAGCGAPSREACSTHKSAQQRGAFVAT
jgi:broad specificity phosphatase PhoE